MKTLLSICAILFTINIYAMNHEGTVCDFYQGSQLEEAQKFHSYEQGVFTSIIRLWGTHLEHLFFELGEQSYDDFYIIEYGTYETVDSAKTKVIDGHFDLTTYFSEIDTTVHCYR